MRYSAAILVAFACLGCLAPRVYAQYPPVPISVVLTASEMSPQPGDRVLVTATVKDPAGRPAAGIRCSFRILSQPGSDASVDAVAPFSTDSGTASANLAAGSTSGAVVVEATCAANSSRISLKVGNSTSNADTGSGTSKSQNSISLLGAGLLAVAVCAAGGISAVFLRRRKSRH